MSEPVYFAVVRAHGRDTPRKFFEMIPRCYSDKNRQHELIYCTRLDTMANGDAMIAAPLDQLFALYRALLKANKLPPEDRGAKPKDKPGETRVSHEVWEPPPVTWDRDAPAYPPLS